MHKREEETRGCTRERRRPVDEHEGGGDQRMHMGEEETSGWT